MTTTEQATPAVPTQEPVFSVQRIYLKGQSLELPAGPRFFLSQTPPALNLNLQVDSSELDVGYYDVTLRATLSAEVEGKVAYLLEVEQSGVFEIRNVMTAQLADILEIGAPSILAPYLRAQLADTLTRATLPVFYMPEVNWQAAAFERRQAAAQAPSEGSVVAPGTPTLQ